MSACARCGTALAGPRCPACGALASLAVDGPGDGAPAVLPPSAAPPPPAYAYPPPGYGYPPPGYGYPPPGYGYPGYGYPPPVAQRPGLGVLAILVLVANYLLICLGALLIAVAIADGPTDDDERALVIAISTISTAALIAATSAVHLSRVWGAILSCVLWGALALVFFIATGHPSTDAEARAGLAIFGVGSLAAAVMAGLSVPQLRRRRDWRPPAR